MIAGAYLAADAPGELKMAVLLGVPSARSGLLLRYGCVCRSSHHIGVQGSTPALKSPHPSLHPEPCWGRPGVHAGPEFDAWGVSFHADAYVMALRRGLADISPEGFRLRDWLRFADDYQCPVTRLVAPT